MGHDVLPCPAPGRPIGAGDPSPQRGRGPRHAPVAALGQDEAWVPRLVQEQASPARPTDGCAWGVLWRTSAWEPGRVPARPARSSGAEASNAPAAGAPCDRQARGDAEPRHQHRAARAAPPPRWSGTRVGPPGPTRDRATCGPPPPGSGGAAQRGGAGAPYGSSGVRPVLPPTAGSRRGLGAGVHRHGPSVCGGPHDGAAPLDPPPQLHALPTPPIQHPRVQAGVAGQVGPGRRPQGPPRAHRRRLDRDDRRGPRDRGAGRHHEDDLPALDAHLDGVYRAALSRALPLAAALPTACRRGR